MAGPGNSETFGGADIDFDLLNWGIANWDFTESALRTDNNPKPLDIDAEIADIDFAQMYEGADTADIFQIDDGWMEQEEESHTPSTSQSQDPQADCAEQDSQAQVSVSPRDVSRGTQELPSEQQNSVISGSHPYNNYFGAFGGPDGTNNQYYPPPANSHMQGQGGMPHAFLPFAPFAYPWNMSANMLADPAYPMVPYHVAAAQYGAMFGRMPPSRHSSRGSSPVLQQPVPRRSHRDHVSALDKVVSGQKRRHSGESSASERGTTHRMQNASPSSASNSNEEKLPYAYQQLESRPPSWGTTRRFRYTHTGELDQAIRMDPMQMAEFLCENPRPVTLLIGRVPLGCNDRYGLDNAGDKGGAMKCRFKCCLDKKGTMEKGTYRVIIDELRSSGKKPHQDPFHNAGYVHLWCLERWMDLPGLMRHPNITVVVDDGKSRTLNRTIDAKYASARLGTAAELNEARTFLSEVAELTNPALPAEYPYYAERGSDPEGNLAEDEDPEHGPYHGTLAHRMAVRKRDHDSALNRHDLTRPKADTSAKSRFRDHLYDLAKQVPGRNRTRRPSGQKSMRSLKRRRESSVMREHVARTITGKRGRADPTDDGLVERASKRVRATSNITADDEDTDDASLFVRQPPLTRSHASWTPAGSAHQSPPQALDAGFDLLRTAVAEGATAPVAQMTAPRQQPVDENFFPEDPGFLDGDEDAMGDIEELFE